MPEIRAVIQAYKTDHYPLGGNLAEEVLLLDDGRAVYLNPADTDEICADLDTALALCAGTPEAAEGLVAAWQRGGGYVVPTDDTPDERTNP